MGEEYIEFEYLSEDVHVCLGSQRFFVECSATGVAVERAIRGASFATCPGLLDDANSCG